MWNINKNTLEIKGTDLELRKIEFEISKDKKLTCYKPMSKSKTGAKEVTGYVDKSGE